MDESQAVTIVVSNTPYTISGTGVDREVLGRAVDAVNERIQNFKQRTNGEEVRATVLAAISLATELTEAADRESNLKDELETIRQWAESLSARMDKEIEKL